MHHSPFSFCNQLENFFINFSGYLMVRVDRLLKRDYEGIKID